MASPRQSFSMGSGSTASKYANPDSTGDGNRYSCHSLYKKRLNAIMDDIANELDGFDMGMCAIVVPVARGYSVMWHDGFKPSIPSHKDLERSRLFQSPLSRDGKAFLLTSRPLFAKDALVTGPTHLSFYVEYPVKGRSGKTVLATICLADKQRKAPALAEAMLEVLGNYSEQVAEAISSRHGEDNDLLLPHTSVLERDLDCIPEQVLRFLFR
eukprot:gb/GFBE01079808.1/.p1 GENE.gb/GFBE01079808.1/~~gb/GFBE01079808.1/.p1  ORF type:complete len:212 (+),score=28.59 gb/GFBE01079808.1/:1-636(+)